MRRAQADCASQRININCHHVVGSVEEEQLLAVSTPMCTDPPSGGDLPFGASTGKGGNVNLRAARFVVLISHPLSVGCDSRVDVIKRSLHDGKWLAVAE